jgi:calcineurin-like phosphoesterase family protein
MVERHNRLVKPSDLVIVVGDVCYLDTPQFLYHVGRFNGNKILIRGNHDVRISDSEFRRYFDRVVPQHFGMEMGIAGIRCYITHEPRDGRPDRFNLVGHVHGIWRVQRRALNVGVDVHHFYPIGEDIVNFYYRALLEHYGPNDVDIAYGDVNAVPLGGEKASFYTVRKVLKSVGIPSGKLVKEPSIPGFPYEKLGEGELISHNFLKTAMIMVPAGFVTMVLAILAVLSWLSDRGSWGIFFVGAVLAFIAAATAFFRFLWQLVISDR